MDIEIEKLIEISKSAGEILLKNYRKSNQVRMKADQTPVTSTDIESENFLRKKLEEIEPSFSIISEESPDRLTDSQFSWIVDPLDGTSNYVHGIPVFATMLALCRKGRPIMSVVHFPVQKETFHAEKGKGTFRGKKRLEVSKEGIEGGFAVFGSKFRRDDAWSCLGKTRKVFSRVRALGSAAANFTKVAEGEAEACLEFGISPWDFIPPALIVEEAGGTVTDLQGEEIDTKTENVVATNGKEHSNLIEILNK